MANLRCARWAAERTEETWEAVAQDTVARVAPVAGLVEVSLAVDAAPWVQEVPSKTPGMWEPGAGRSSDAKICSIDVAGVEEVVVGGMVLDGVAVAGAVVGIGSGMVVVRDGLITWCC